VTIWAHIPLASARRGAPHRCPLRPLGPSRPSSALDPHSHLPPNDLHIVCFKLYLNFCVESSPEIDDFTGRR
jgi:hypothetical protein